MSYHFKIMKKILIISVFCFLFSATHNAQAAFNVAGCVSTGIAGAIAQSTATGAAEAAATAGAGAAATGASAVASVAAVPTADAVAAGLLGTVSGVNIAHTAFQDVGKMTLDNAFYVAAQCALSFMTENTVAWIKGGYNGSPSFAVDPQQLFLDIANSVSGGLVNQIRGIATCNFTPNFNFDLANMVDLSGRSGYYDKFDQSIRCPFPANINASQFYRDFNQGGWKGFETSLQDSGNPFGLKVRTAEELATRQKEMKDLKVEQLGWAGGFLPMETCELDSYGVAQICKTTTPGKTISDQLSKTLGTDMDRLGAADNMNKIITAVIGQLTSNLATGIFH